MDYKVLNFKVNGDERGSLVAVEGNGDIPFEIRRVFYIFDTKGKDIIRGNHANRKTKFVLVMLAGSCKVKVFSQDGSFEIVDLDTPSKGLFLNNMVWKEMYDFSDNSAMMVLASEHFDKYEYIDTYEELIQELKEKRG